MKLLGWFFRLVLFFLLLSFSLRNTQPVVVEMVPGYVLQAPLIIVLLLTFVAGVALTWLLMLPSIIASRRLRQATELQTQTPHNNEQK